MSSNPKSQELRNKIRSLVKEFYEVEHAPLQKRQFEPGVTSVNYAGRVFDSQEMEELVDSSLDFWLTAGRYCDQFEAELAKTVGTKFALAVNSGSSANLVAFSALTSALLGDRRIRPGDEVITVAAGFPTTVNPILQFGAVPVFVDVTVDDGTYDIDINSLEAALSPKTKAVMIAHTLGNPFDLDAVRKFCDQHNLWLVEDNCDALGSTYKGKMTGSFGDLSTSSFYPAHHITTGEGGAVYTSNPTLKRAAESFRDWGRDCWCPSGKDNTCKKRFGWSLGQLPQGYDHKYIYRHLGYNLKMTEMQAAIGVAQLKKLSEFSRLRRENWNYFRDRLSKLSEFFIMPNPTAGSEPSWFGFILTLKDSAKFERQELVKFLEDRKIQTRMLFAGNYLKHPVFDELRDQQIGFRTVGKLSQADRIMTKSFWFGVYPGMKPGMLPYICDSIEEFCRGRN